MTDETLIARARRSVDDKTDRRVYTPELLAALDAPLDLRPNPEVAGGVAWPEALRTASITVGPPPRSTRPVVGPILTALKRAAERSLRWYLPPVAGQISAHNRAVIEVLSEHNRQIVELYRELEELRRRVTELEAQLRPSPRGR